MKQGRNNHQTTILDLVRPTAHELSRAGFPPPLTLSCCGTYLQRGNGVDVQGDSTARYPAHCRDQRTRVTSGKWHGSRAPGLPSCRTWSARCAWSAMLRFRGGDRERSSTSESLLPTSAFFFYYDRNARKLDLDYETNFFWYGCYENVPNSKSYVSRKMKRYSTS